MRRLLDQALTAGLLAFVVVFLMVMLAAGIGAAYGFLDGRFWTGFGSLVVFLVLGYGVANAVEEEENRQKKV